MDARMGLTALLIAACMFPNAASAQAGEDPKKEGARVLEVGRWYPSVEAGLNIAQSSYSENWAGGDKGSVVWAAIVNASAENQIHRKLNWNNTLKLAYGQTHQQRVESDGSRAWDSPDKSTDLLDLESIARFTLGGFVDPFASVRFESQFQDASDPDGRILALNPIRFKESAGIARKFVDREEQALLSRLGLTLRQTARRLYSGPAPDDATTTETSNDGGLEWVTDAKRRFFDKRIAWTSKLSLYKPFFYSGKDELEDLPLDELEAANLDRDVADYSTAIDVDFENIFSSEITKLISVNLYTRWVYDKYDNSVLPILGSGGGLENGAVLRQAIRKSGQFKQTLSIGLTYRFL